MNEPKNWYRDSSITTRERRQSKCINRSTYFDDMAKKEEHLKELAQEKQATMGNNKYIREGMIARIFGEYLIDLSSKKYTKNDIQSFIYGYYDTANRQISLMCSEHKLTEHLVKASEALLNANKETLEDLSVEELLFSIGYRDSKDSQINVNDFEEVIKQNKNYSEGYMSGIEELNNKKGKGGR